MATGVELTNFILSASSIGGLIALIKCVLYIAEIRATAKQTADEFKQFADRVDETIERIETNHDNLAERVRTNELTLAATGRRKL